MQRIKSVLLGLFFVGMFGWGLAILAGGHGAAGTSGASAGVLLSGSSDTQVLFNDGGAFAGDAGMTFNKTTNALGVGGATTITGSADGVQLNVKGHSTQTGAIQTWSNSAGTVLLQLGPTARIATPNDNWGLRFDVGGYGAMLIDASSTQYIGIDSTGGGGITSGTLGMPSQTLTAGTLTATSTARARKTTHRYDWTNAMVVALGAGLTGDVTVCTLPAKTVVTNAYIVITGQGAGVTTLTVALGRTSAAYIDYIPVSDAKVAANTVYGNTIATKGAKLGGTGATQNDDLASYTGTTAVKLHFISTVENLDQTTGSTGAVYLETMTLP